MKTSEQINEIGAALAKAQGEFDNPLKDATNPHFRSSYATLAAVLDAVRGPLSKNGLALIQITETTESGTQLVTRLVHSSGQWIEGRMPLILAKEDMQGAGSAITYARRYAAAAITGVAQTDDDGEDASGRVPHTQHDPVPVQQPVQSAHRGPVQGRAANMNARFQGNTFGRRPE